jgi:hypothetical protein
MSLGVGVLILEIAFSLTSDVRKSSWVEVCFIENLFSGLGAVS